LKIEFVSVRDKHMPKIKIDNKIVNAGSKQTVLEAALHNGIFIPHFCWHALLSVSGNCRMCVVEVVGRQKLEVSCNLLVSDGMEILTDSPAVKKAREDVLEFLLLNHPLDCPVCDQAGECLLQDYHFKYSGKPSRRKTSPTRKSKCVDLGSEIMLDNERCILCSRCVRFLSEVTKTGELCIAKRGERSFVTTAPGQTLENPYSLCTVEYCPVGALTSKDFRFQKRVWFLKSTPSICPNCSRGCPMWIDHEDGRMWRWRSRNTCSCVHDETGIASSMISCKAMMCDEGRLSYRVHQASTRLISAVKRSNNEKFETISKHEGRAIFSEIISKENADKIVVALSAHLSCEEIDHALDFFRSIGVKKIYRTGRPEAPSFEDDILRKADKNPNTAHLRSLGIEEMPPLPDGEILFVADALSSEEIVTSLHLGFKKIVQATFDVRFILPAATLVLPLATFAEKNGSFVNFKGQRQRFAKAFEPKGDAAELKEWLK